MARLASFKVDYKKVEDGQWVSPGDEYDDLQVLVRGYTDAYTDYRAARLRRAAANYGGDTGKVPAAKSREIMVDALVQHVLLDVKNLSDENGEPVPFAKFVELLRDPSYADLVLAVLKAAALVGTERAAELDDTKKN